MWRVLRARRRGDRGAVAVEFALVFPFLVLIVFAIIQYGFYFWAMQGGASAAREAARKAAVGMPTSCTDFSNQVKENVDAMESGNFKVTRTFASSPAKVGDDVDVTVTFESIDMGFPFVPFISKGLVEERATARVETFEDPANPPGNCS